MKFLIIPATIAAVLVASPPLTAQPSGSVGSQSASAEAELLAFWDFPKDDGLTILAVMLGANTYCKKSHGNMVRFTHRIAQLYGMPEDQFINEITTAVLALRTAVIQKTADLRLICRIVNHVEKSIPLSLRSAGVTP